MTPEDDPITFIARLMNEFIEDCAYVLKIDYMPDE